VRDNGVRQVIESVSYQEAPTSATLVLDMSGSVSGNLIDRLKGAGSQFFLGLRDRDRAALLTFSSKVKLESPLSTDFERVKLDLNRIKAQSFGNTSLIDASYAGLIYADSVPDRSLLVVFSDGLDTTSWLSEEDVLESAKQSDVVVYTISAGGLRDYDFFRDLAKTTGGSFFKIEDTQDLKSVFLNILEEFRHRYLLTYSPRGVKRSGWHEIKVKVKKHSHDEVRARPGYMIESTEF